MSESGTRTDELATTRRLCLDFSNTVEWRAGDRPQESLTGYADLVKWGVRAGVMTDRGARQLLRESSRRPKEADRVFERAIILREVIYGIFSAIAAGRAPRGADLDALNDALSDALSRSRVARTAGGFVWGWGGREGALDQMLWPVVRSAAELLTSDDLQRVRSCAGAGCGWLFLDVSRNRLRRWCDMKSCGNRAKARRHYERVRAGR